MKIIFSVRADNKVVEFDFVKHDIVTLYDGTKGIATFIVEDARDNKLYDVCYIKQIGYYTFSLFNGPRDFLHERVYMRVEEHPELGDDLRIWPTIETLEYYLSEKYDLIYIKLLKIMGCPNPSNDILETLDAEKRLEVEAIFQ